MEGAGNRVDGDGGGGAVGACEARQAVILQQSRHRLQKAVESTRPQNTRSAYARERARWEEYLQKKELSAILDHVTASTPGVIADYLAERLRIYSSSKNTLSNSVLKQAKAVLSRMFEEKEWTGPWRSSGGPNGRAEGNPMRSDTVQQIVKLRRDAAAREGTVPINADPLEYEMLAMSFQTVKKELKPCLTSRCQRSNGPLEFTDNYRSMLSPVSLRFLRAYSFAVIAMGTLSRFTKLACRKFAELQVIHNDLLYLDFDSGTKTTRSRVHRILRHWEGLDDHRIDPPSLYRLWMRVRGSEASESEYIFPHVRNEGDLCVSTPMEESEWTRDMRTLLRESSIRKSFVDRISTHSCRRGGVQLMLDLGYSVSSIMAIGGWESIEAFWYYTRPCNRRKSRFASRGLLRAQLLHMQNTNFYLRGELSRIKRNCACNTVRKTGVLLWPEATYGATYFLEPEMEDNRGEDQQREIEEIREDQRREMGRMHRSSLRDPFIDAIFSPDPLTRRAEQPESPRERTSSINETSSIISLIASLEGKVDKILQSGGSRTNRAAHHSDGPVKDQGTEGTAANVHEAAANSSAPKQVTGVVKRLVPPACSFSEVRSDWEKGRTGLRPLKEIWKKRKHLCYRDKELLRKRLDVMLYYYDVRRHRGDLAWEEEILKKNNKGKVENRKLGEILGLSRKYLSLEHNRERKKALIKEITK